MLTPVDIRQRKFHAGVGYDKKDVNTFFEEVASNYEQLYRSHAELKEEVATLKDSLQHYRSKEAELDKAIKLAEKDAEDMKTKAHKEAKIMESDAKNRAKAIVEDAEISLERMQLEMTTLETQYAAYKSNFVSLMKKQFEQLKELDFNPESYIDERALSLLGGGVVKVQQAAPSGGDFGSFEGDPQMRDESSLGGMQASGGFGSGGDINSTSAVYTSALGANEDFVDPFNPSSNTRYNPFEDTSVDNRNTKAVTGNSNFKVNKSGTSRNYTRSSKKTASAGKASSPSVAKEFNTPKASETATTRSNDNSSAIKPESTTSKINSEAVDNTTVDNTTVDNTTVDNTTVGNTTVDNTSISKTSVDNITAPTNDTKTKAEAEFTDTNSQSNDTSASAINNFDSDNNKLNSSELHTGASKTEEKSEFKYETRKNKVDNSGDIPIVHLYPDTSLEDDEETSLVGEVEEKPSDFALLSDGSEDDSNDKDEFGFEFI